MPTPHPLRHRLLRQATIAILAGPLLAAALLGDARAGTIPGVTRQVQRFFPDTQYSVRTVDPATDLLTLAVNFPVGKVANVLVTANGGAASTVVLQKYVGGSPAPSADPSLLYAIRGISAKKVKLYASRADAVNNVNAIDFTTANTTPFQFSIASSNWCWDACSNMIFGNYGVAGQTQDSVADYALIPTTAAGQPPSGKFINKPNHLSSAILANTDGLLKRKGTAAVLKGLGDIDSVVYNQLTAAELQAEIDGNRPMIFQIGWYSAGAGTTRNGGHVIVGYGLTGDNLTVADPWPTSTTSVLSLATFTTAYQGTGIWEKTLVTAKALDVVFVIDTTGSMGGTIAQVKTYVASIINNIATKFKSYRLAVMDYKDLGDPYIFRTDAAFTTNPAAATAAVNSLSASGGGDTPEAVYSATYAALSGTGIGAWRTGPVVRQIIVIGDAEGHNPETFAGGQSSASVLAKASDPALPIHISGIIVGGSPKALAMSDDLAGGSGGVTIDSANASGVPAAINQAIDELAESARYPRLEVAALKPLFTFNDRDPAGMENRPKSITLQLERQGKTKFAVYRRLTVPATADSARFVAALPLGFYRWRLSLLYPTHTILNPDGALLRTSRAHRTVEETYTEFERQLVIPQAITGFSPSASGFTASSTSQTYSFNTSLNSASYVMEIYKAGKLWKRLVLRPPVKDPGAASLSVLVKGHTLGKQYTWRVQGLNYDRPKADPTKFSP